MNRLIGTVVTLFLLSLYWMARGLHSLPLGDDALGVLIVLMILLALLWDSDRRAMRASVLRCVRLLVWAVCLLAIGWLEPILIRLMPADGGGILPGLLVGIGSAALVLTEEVKIKVNATKN